MEGKVWNGLRAHHVLATSEQAVFESVEWQGWVIPGDSWLGSKQ